MSKNFRTAYVVKRYPRFSETFIVNEILAHEAAGAQIDIFSLYSPGDTHFQSSISRVKAPVYYLPSKGIDASDFWTAFRETSLVIPDLGTKLSYAFQTEARYVYQAFLLAQQIRRNGIDHIHSHFATSSTTVARLASFFADVPYSFTAHAKDIYHQDVQNEQLDLKLRDASAVITVSQFNVQHLQNTYPDNAEKVCCVYNGMDLDSLQYSIPGRRPAEILAIGRFVPKKGFSYLIEACSILKKLGKDFHCTIIGFGELDLQFRTQIRLLNLEDIIELTGPLPQNEVICRIQKSAALVAPCIIAEDGNRDGLPTVLLESMALGTPCISTDVTGIPEIIQHGVTGLLAPQKDAYALSIMVDQLLTNPALRIQLSRNARSLIEKKFDISRNAAMLRSIFANARSYGTVSAVS